MTVVWRNRRVTVTGCSQTRLYSQRMGRIADAALDRLASGPADPEALAVALARSGATRAKDPATALRRVIRDDSRFVILPDGRLASVAQLLAGIVLTVRVSEAAHLRGWLDTDGDLAPFATLGATRAILPVEVQKGELVLVRLADHRDGRLAVDRAAGPLADAAAERVLITAARHRLAGAGDRGVRLAAVACDVAAADPDAYRGPARPLSDALGDAGLEIHLGWVAPAGTRWGVASEREVAALERAVSDELAADRPVAAAELQDRLLSLLRMHFPERVPDARRRLARVLARGGRVGDGLSVLTAAFGFGDPEDRYEACLLAIRLGDVVSARRWAEEGLARIEVPAHADVALCLDDIAGDLDAHATYQSVVAWLPPPSERVAAAPELAIRMVSPRRSYLVGALIEQCFADLDEIDAIALITTFRRLGSAGREVCLAVASVLEGAPAQAARHAAGPGRHARRAAVQGLVSAAPVAAWVTAPGDSAAQQHMLVAVAKEAGRWSPLIVAIDHPGPELIVRDAFFLNDLSEERFRRELLRPITELGLPLHELPVTRACTLLGAGLERAAARGHVLPALEYQPVAARIRTLVLGPDVPDAPPHAPEADRRTQTGTDRTSP